MGVDWFPCHNCEESVCDCGDYVACSNCYTRWCSEECAKEEGWDGEDDDKREREEDTCKYCRKEDMKDHELIPLLLKKLKLTRQQAVKLFNK